MDTRHMLRRSFLDNIRRCFKNPSQCEFDTVCKLVERNGFAKVNVSDDGMQVVIGNMVSIDLDSSFPLRGDLYLV